MYYTEALQIGLFLYPHSHFVSNRCLLYYHSQFTYNPFARISFLQMGNMWENIVRDVIYSLNDGLAVSHFDVTWVERRFSRGKTWHFRTTGEITATIQRSNNLFGLSWKYCPSMWTINVDFIETPSAISRNNQLFGQWVFSSIISHFSIVLFTFSWILCPNTSNNYDEGRSRRRRGRRSYR